MPELTLDTLRTLVSFDTRNPPRSIAGGDGLVSEVARMLRATGFDVRTRDLGDGCHNILAVRGRPSILFNVHLDTVPPAEGWTGDPFDLRIDDGRIIGLGACDVKGAAACLLSAAMTTDGPAALLLTTDEEAGDSRCVRTFLDDVPGWIRGVVVAEPTGCRAVTAHRGVRTCEGVFTGVGGHSSSPDGATSAVHDAVRWAAMALDYAAQAESMTCEQLRGIRFNLGVIEGGIKPNMIAAKARVVFGIRPLPGHDGRRIADDLCKCAPDASRVAWRTRFAGPALLPTDASRALAGDLDFDAGPAVDFWTEAALFAAAGLPSIVFGPGDIRQAHAADEWIAADQLSRATATYQRLFSLPAHPLTKVHHRDTEDTEREG